MRILVFGAGAIGSLLGHRLSHAGHDVTLVGRPSYVRAVQAHGLLLEEDGEISQVRPTVVEALDSLPAGRRAWDLVVLTVKVYDTQEAARALAPCIPQNTPLLIVQNGVGGEELAQQVLSHTTTISGVITLVVSVLAPGHIRLDTSRGGLSLASTREGQHVAEWAELLAEAGLKTVICRDYRAQKWTKLLLNILGNVVPAILDMSPGEVFADPYLFRIERAAFLEALAVMSALKLRAVRLCGYPVALLAWAMRTLPVLILRPLLARLIGSGRGEKKPSLQIDLACGKQRSEALYLNGAVATHARRAGIDAPVNKALLTILMGIAKGTIPWDEFRQHPQKLIKAVHNWRDKDHAGTAATE